MTVGKNVQPRIGLPGRRRRAASGRAAPLLGFFGAAPDTGNLGVSALFAATVAAVHARLPRTRIIAFDNGAGRRRVCHHTAGDEAAVEVELVGCRGGRRYYRSDNLAGVALAAALGRAGAVVNPVVRVIDRCAAVLDVSGGDSFCDIYGPQRFANVVRPKEIVLARGRPLVLLPQTYGPCRDAALRRRASAVVRRAEVAWARDAESFAVLRDWLGDDFDPHRHRCGVDLAFGLRPRRPATAVCDHLEELRAGGTPLVGINVSGLIYNDPHQGRRFGLRADYQDVLQSFLTWLLREQGARVVLVPHVLTPPGHYESDAAASAQLLAKLPLQLRVKVSLLPVKLDQSETKWVIGQLDWFLGTRMHATIAALSSGVPAAAISYSDKTRGVFADCGVAAHVHDPRVLHSDAITAALRQSFLDREEARLILAALLPEVQQRCQDQLGWLTTRLSALTEG